MYKVLIVDDDRESREDLLENIDWEKLQIKVIGVVLNGKEALSIITAHQPDIVITDIKIPFLNGVELIEQSRLLSPDTVFIVLSGDCEFDAARRTMSCGVRHYLMKPCTEEQLVPVINEIKSNLLDERKKDAIINTIREHLEEMPSSVRSLFPPDFTAWSSQEQYGYIGTRHGNIAQIMMRYVQVHYADPELSLKQLAREVVFMNDGYLGKLFKKEVGEKFTQYVLRVRMENAKFLIENSDGERLYEVAMQVGLGENPQYFSQLFKKYVGYTPSEYKRMLQQNMHLIKQN